MEIQTETVTLEVNDGTLMKAFVAKPASQKIQRAIIVLQETFGVNAHIKEVTKRFAKEGYVAIAPDLFHRTAPLFEGDYNDLPGSLKYMALLKDPELEFDLKATHDWLIATNNSHSFPISAVGFCMGGRVAFLASLILSICAVSFYGGGIAPNDSNAGLIHRVNALNKPLLLFWAGLDNFITLEQTRTVIDALRHAKKDYVNVEFSNVNHGFFCDARQSYHPQVAAQAWQLTLSFLHEHML